MALIPVFLLLFAAWMLWGWLVSDVRDIRWMRKWCAIVFVVMAVLMSAGAGVGITMAVLKRQFRAEVRDFALVVKKQLDSGNQQMISEELQQIIEPTDAFPGQSSDILQRLEASKQRLQSGQRRSTAQGNSRIRL
ncbi:MAG: hypothetical protein JNL58_13735 [Planctomyces sp.]|nr:hypothetical protein [Planctomyces sp.]